MPYSDTDLQESDDQQLVKLTKKGNQLAFRTLITRLEPKLMGFIIKRGASHCDAQDILQETFIAAYRNLDKFDPDKPFSAWIFGIARNHANNQFRKIKPAIDPDKVTEPFDSSTPLAKADLNDQADTFWKEANRLLSKDEFDATWLRYQQNLPLKEIATTLNKSLSNIKIHLFRARKSLAASPFLAEQHLSASNIAI